MQEKEGAKEERGKGEKERQKGEREEEGKVGGRKTGRKEGR